MAMADTTMIISGIAGGSLIGLAASILLLGCGEIMGASGITSSYLMHPMRTYQSDSQKWKILFLAAFCIAANLLGYTHGADTSATNGPFITNFSFAVGGLLTGFGTKLSQGCTTGHGICGMARLNQRSIVGALSFMSFGFITSSVLGSRFNIFRASAPMFTPNRITSVFAYLVVGTLMYFSIQIIRPKSANCELADAENMPVETSSLKQNIEMKSDIIKKAPFAVLSGAVFALGLDVSHMIDNRKILNFLDVTGIKKGEWDPSLAFVMASGVIISGMSYQYIGGFNHIIQNPLRLMKVSFSKADFNIPAGLSADKKLFVGAVVFGVGWGVAGFCPGPAAYLACVGYPQVMALYMPMFTAGALLAEMEYTQSLLS
jgi:uncharacterized membrane protein YedE/YeeE